MDLVGGKVKREIVGGGDVVGWGGARPSWQQPEPVPTSFPLPQKYCRIIPARVAAGGSLGIKTWQLNISRRGTILSFRVFLRVFAIQLTIVGFQQQEHNAMEWSWSAIITLLYPVSQKSIISASAHQISPSGQNIGSAHQQRRNEGVPRDLRQVCMFMALISSNWSQSKWNRIFQNKLLLHSKLFSGNV